MLKLLKSLFAVVYVGNNCNYRYTDREDDKDNDEGSVLEQDHIWEQPKTGEVQHG